mmetsp:Transcript_5900/g.26114  ORF Transcript_5900/g.26114 Transcript_5900/m.26114 type:complete len:236 (-) Transcript_5900:1809-2516(-)
MNRPTRTSRARAPRRRMSSARRRRRRRRLLAREGTRPLRGSAATARWPRAASTSTTAGPGRRAAGVASSIPATTRPPCAASGTRCGGWRERRRWRDATCLEGRIGIPSRRPSAGATPSCWTCRRRSRSASRRSASYRRRGGGSARCSRRTRSSRRRSARRLRKPSRRMKKSLAPSARRKRRRLSWSARSSASARRTGGCSSGGAAAWTTGTSGVRVPSRASSEGFSPASTRLRKR